MMSDSHPIVLLAASLALIVLAAPLAGCDPIEESHAGLFDPFPPGVTSHAGEGPDGGTMELPDASTFVPDEDGTAGAGDAVAGGDDDSADDGSAAAFTVITEHKPSAVSEVTEVPAVTTVPAEPVQPQPAAVQPAAVQPAAVQPAAVQPVAQPPADAVALAPGDPAAPAPAAPSSTICGEAALLVSAPLSEIALVAAIAAADPPRAIVRFPGGEERVVRIGDMLGDRGAKVVLIGEGHIKLTELSVDEPDSTTLITHYLHASR